MKVLGRRCQVADLHVVLRAELEKPAEMTVGMLRSLAFVTVGEKHHKTVSPVPFGLSGGDKLIDDHLSAVHKVAKLCLPEGHHVRL